MENKTITISEMAFVHYFHPNEDGFENAEYRQKLEKWLADNNVSSLSYNDANHETDQADSAAYHCPILDIYDTARTVEVIYK